MEKIIKKPIRKVLPLLLGSTLLLAGCTDTVKDKALDIAKDTVVLANEKAGEMIDNHEYRVFPWELFLTEEDREILNEPDIPKLSEIAFESYPIIDSIDHVTSMMVETNEFINDFTLYEEYIDDETVLGDPIYDIYENEEATKFFTEQIGDMYSREYTYPESIDLVMLELERVEDAHEWILHLEWKALQDSNEFLVYPIEMRLSDDYKYLEATAKNPVNSAVFTRPLTNESVVDNTSHQVFLDEWNEFKRTFNRDMENSATLDDSHLSTLASDEIELSTLQSMFDASHGNLDNGSFTAWRMNDKDADAISVYTLSIPKDHEGNILKVDISFSRPYGKILGIDTISN